MVTTRLEEKLARIRKDPQGARDFLICDAKDGDMGGGIPMPGPRRDGEGRASGAFKTRRDYLDQIAALVRQDIVDLMLLSVANNHDELARSGTRPLRALEDDLEISEDVLR